MMLMIMCFTLHFIQRYSGTDFLGVTAKVVDMPHHCKLQLLLVQRFDLVYKDVSMTALNVTLSR